MAVPDKHEDDTKKVLEPNPSSKPPALDDIKGLLGWIEGKKEESKSSGKSWTWVMGLIAAAVVFIALAYAAYTAWKQGREIAKLKHKIDVEDEKKQQVEADMKININKEGHAKLVVEAATLGNIIEEGKKQIGELEAERKAINSKIDRVTSWEDVDKL